MDYDSKHYQDIAEKHVDLCVEKIRLENHSAYARGHDQGRINAQINEINTKLQWIETKARCPSCKSTVSTKLSKHEPSVADYYVLSCHRCGWNSLKDPKRKGQLSIKRYELQQQLIAREDGGQNNY